MVLQTCIVLATEGCSSPAAPAGPIPAVEPLEPLPVQQMQVYPHTATGRFAALADFEDSPDMPGRFQVGAFRIEPACQQGAVNFTVNITRTGAGAMRVDLPVGAELVFEIPYLRDFRPYSLLSLALHSQTIRGDLRISLHAGESSWTALPTLIKPGWNSVAVDIRNLSEIAGFDAGSVRQLRLGFSHAGGPVTFYLDDILLIDNRRILPGVPAGMIIAVHGLEYKISLPNRPEPLVCSQSPDGLWRMGVHQPLLQVSAGGGLGGSDQENISLLGDRRIGQVELLECNPIRVRLMNTWFFPDRSGEWVSMSVRQVRWEHTFYADGRWVINIELNNAGGCEVRQVAMRLSERAAWSDGTIGDRLVDDDLPAPVGRWSGLLISSGTFNQGKTPAGQADTDAVARKYRMYHDPGEFRPKDAGSYGYAAGDENRDGYDESHGCYYLYCQPGLHRLILRPGRWGVRDPVIAIGGDSDDKVSVVAAGLAIRRLISETDMHVFIIPGEINEPIVLEITRQSDN